MALTIVIEGKGVITDAESTTDWYEEGSGSAPGDGTDTFLQGTQSVDSKVSGSGAAGCLYYDIGVGNELAFDDSGLLVQSVGADTAWQNIGETANDLYMAGAFSTPSAFSLIKVEIDLKRTGTPSSNLFCEIRADNGDEPSGSVLATANNNFAPGDIGTTQATYTFLFDPESLSGSTQYWIVLRTATSSGTDYYEARRGGESGAEIDDSPDGTTWSLAANNVSFFMTLWSQAEDVTGQLVYMWINCTTLGALNTLANGGLQIWLGSDDSAGGMVDYYSAWTFGGSDDFRGYTGGWKCIVIDPTLTPTDTGTNPVGLGGIRYFGFYIDTVATVFAAANMMVDTIAVGSGLRITGTDVTGWQEVSDYCNDFANRAWGMLQEKEGIYYIYGRLNVGDSGQGAVTSLTDAGRVLRFGDFEYYNGSIWVTGIPNGNNGLTVEDAASFITTFQDGIIVGTNAGRSGSVFIGSEFTDTTFDLYGGLAAGSLTKLYGSILKGIDGGITWGDDGDHHCYSVSFEECAQFDPVGGPLIRNCLFIATVSIDAALLWNGSINIQNCSFIANTNGAGIEQPTHDTSIGYTDLIFSGNTYDIVNTAEAVNVDEYDSSNQSSQFALNDTYSRCAQTFVGTAGQLTRARFFLQKVASPTGNAYAKLYATSGGAPTGAALATSEAFDVTILTGSYVNYGFEFKDEYTLAAATTYAISIEYTNGDAVNYVWVGVDNTSPTHSGSAYSYDSSWTVQPVWDICFRVNKEGYAKINATDSNPSTYEFDALYRGAVEIINSVNLTITVQDEAGDPIQDAQTAIYTDDAARTELMNEDTLSSGIATQPYNYIGDQDIEVRVRKASPGDTQYINFSTLGKIESGGYSLLVTLAEDPNNAN